MNNMTQKDALKELLKKNKKILVHVVTVSGFLLQLM